MSCQCGAEYGPGETCPRCEKPEAFYARRSLDRPGNPDGPDELLSAIADLGDQLEAERSMLVETGGARRCRYCKGLIPPGPEPGTHERCLPAVLPEGARSCTGCAELVLDDDDTFEHDFCLCPGDEMPPEDGEDDDPYDVDGLMRFATAEHSSEEAADPLEDALPPYDADVEEVIPTEPLPAATHAPLRMTDEVLCGCGRWLSVSMIAPLQAIEHHVVSATSVDCPCAMRIYVAYSWRRGCITSLKFERQSTGVN